MFDRYLAGDGGGKYLPWKSLLYFVSYMWLKEYGLKAGWYKAEREVSFDPAPIRPFSGLGVPGEIEITALHS